MFGANKTSRSLNGAFDSFRKKLELTTTQREKIISSHSHLRQNILQKLSYIKNTSIFGSYKKSTMIRPAEDVDIFVELEYRRADITPQAVLNRLKRDLKSSYPNSTIRQGKPCIVVEFNHITFDLTPVICETSFWEEEIFIPSYSENSWMRTEKPDEEMKRLSEANSDCGGRLVPLIKMMKACKRKNGFTNLRSYEMEKIALRHFERSILDLLYYSFDSYREGVQILLEKYDWGFKEFSLHELKQKTPEEYHQICRDVLFGQEFPR